MEHAIYCNCQDCVYGRGEICGDCGAIVGQGCGCDRYSLVHGGFSDGIYRNDEMILSATTIEHLGYDWWSLIGKSDGEIKKIALRLLEKLEHEYGD